MLDAFLFVGLPYVALFVLVAGTAYRVHYNKFSYSSLSSQFLESKRLKYGSMPFHVGILIILVGHVIPVLVPGLWQALTANYFFLLLVESLGIIAAFLALFGLCALAYRRLTSSKIQAVTTPVDLAVLGLLIAQVCVGIGVAGGYRWGASWSTDTTTPYLWSLVTLQPQTDLILGLPPTVKLHLVLAWLLFMLVPFSRLVHLFAFPLSYLWRPPIKVVWTNPRRFEVAREVVRRADDGRRYFLRGAVGIGAAATLLSVGTLDKLGRYFRGPVMSEEEEAEMLAKKLERLELAAHERELELERLNSNYIFVARLGELNEKDGRYFTDYEMRPALAFRDANGLPLLISAKCTHLGCTVASTLDNDGRLLCPCHVSYFDVHTGAPNPGSPANAPLPRLGWVLMDPAGEIVASQGSGGETHGSPEGDNLDGYGVYIAKHEGEIA